MGTIKSSREIDSIFRGAKRAAHTLVVVLAVVTSEQRGHTEGRVAFVAGKKLGNAPQRNRSKRVLRESARRMGGPWAGYDIVFIARPATRIAAAADLDRALMASLRKAGVRE